MSPPDDASPFSSTEEYYAEYRPGYGDRAIEHLHGRFQLDRSARVLDLGCGAGQIAIPLSDHVGGVVGMDPNDAMLEQARARADAEGRENIEWKRGSDADLDDSLGTFRLTTMGRSFHWMDQERTLERLYRMTEPGGGIAIINDDEWFTRGVHEWQDEVYDVADRYVDDLPERTGPISEYDDPWDELIAEFGFVDVEEYTTEFEREWTEDDIVGYLFSLSFCSPETFGDHTDDFESDVRSVVAADDRNRLPQAASLVILSGKKSRDD